MADAKDRHRGRASPRGRPGTRTHGAMPQLARAEFLDPIHAIVHQDVVDVMLSSVSNFEMLVNARRSPTGVKPAFRANDTTDVWRDPGGTSRHASRPFRTATLPRVKPLTDLGLYSITYTNDINADVASLRSSLTNSRRRGRQRDLVLSRALFLNPNVDAA